MSSHAEMLVQIGLAVIIASAANASAAAAQTPATMALSAAPSCVQQAQAEVRSRFPSERFVVGIGIVGEVRKPADGQQRSQHAAILQISQQLETRVDYELEMLSAQDAHAATRSTTLRSRQSSSLVLKNVQFEQACYLPENEEYRTWAVLDRAAAARGATSTLLQVNEHGAKVYAEMKAWLQTGKIRESLLAMDDLRELVTDAREQLQMLRALGESSDGGFLDDAGMDAFEREARGKARTRVVFAAGPWDSVRSQVETELTNHDLPVSTDGNNAVFEVRGTVRLLSLAQSQLSGAIIAELQADVAIGYVGRAESIASLQVREKGAGRTETDATLAAEKKLAARLGRNASDELTKHLAMHDKR